MMKVERCTWTWTGFETEKKEIYIRKISDNRQISEISYTATLKSY
jgi:hypothetical protein